MRDDGERGRPLFSLWCLCNVGLLLGTLRDLGEVNIKEK